MPARSQGPEQTKWMKNVVVRSSANIYITHSSQGMVLASCCEKPSPGTQLHGCPPHRPLLTAVSVNRMLMISTLMASCYVSFCASSHPLTSHHSLLGRLGTHVIVSGLHSLKHTSDLTRGCVHLRSASAQVKENALSCDQQQRRGSVTLLRWTYTTAMDVEIVMVAGMGKNKMGGSLCPIPEQLSQKHHAAS